MQQRNIEKLKQKRAELVKQLLQLDGWSYGSLISTERKSNNKRYPFHYLSRSVNGKNKITYVSKGKLEEVKRILRNGKKCQEIFELISELSIAIVKNKK